MFLTWFLTNNSSDLVLTLCIMFCLFLARLPGISSNSSENHRHYNFQTLANISGIIKKSLEVIMPMISVMLMLINNNNNKLFSL